MDIGELVVKLGVKADTMTVRDFAKSISDIPISVATAIVSIAGLSYGFVEMTKNVLEMTSGFQVFTSETGLNTKALQQWQQVAKEAGLSGDVVTSALSTLASLMGGMRTGHVNRAAMLAMGQLGVGSNFMNKTPYELLNEIQSATIGKNPMIASSLLGAMGLSPELMRVFQTPQGVRERIPATMGGGDIATMAQFQKELAQFNQVTMHEFVKALVGIEPYMSTLATALTALISTFGEAAQFWLSYAHGDNIFKRSADGLWQAATIDPQTIGRTLIYDGGDVTYNINGLNSNERTHREAVEMQMRRETLQRQQASTLFGQGGS